MSINLLDESLRIEVFYDAQDCNFQDNVCLTIYESCPRDEKIFRAGETHLFISAAEARRLAGALLQAAEESEQAAQSDC